jgi:hypothetical protein
MPTKDRIVFTISTPRTVLPDIWQRFADRTRAEGSDPRAVLRRLIEFYVEKGLPHDASTHTKE